MTQALAVENTDQKNTASANSLLAEVPGILFVDHVAIAVRPGESGWPG